MLGPLLLVAAPVVMAAAGVFAPDTPRILRLRSPFAASDLAFPQYVSALVSGALTTGNQVGILTNGDAIFPAMLEAIDRGRRRIVFETEVYEAGDIGSQFSHALSWAARRGVQVSLLLDAVGSRAAARADLERMEQAGCEIRWFNPVPWTFFAPESHRTHRNLLIVDGDAAFLGGAGIADRWTGDAQDGDHWRGTQLRIAGPLASQLEAAFYENWIKMDDAVEPIVNLAPRLPDAGSGALSLMIRSSSAGGHEDLRRLYLVSIAGARRTLDIAAPTFTTNPALRWALSDARHRGVRVRILVEGGLVDRPGARFASRDGYAWLLDHGIELYEYEGTPMRVNALIADGTWSIVGSSFFSELALEPGEELTVAVGDRAVARGLAEDFENDLQKSSRLSRGAWELRPLDEKVREKLWASFAGRP